MFDDFEVQLTVGTEPVIKHRFGKGPYDSVQHSTVCAEAGEVVPLTRYTKRSAEYSPDRDDLAYGMHPRLEGYAGTAWGMVPISSIARTLNEGGKLELAELPDDGPLAAA